MKKYVLQFLFLIAFFINNPAFAESALEKSINENFATYTGWFVSLIFAPLPGTEFP
ncbi:MULTISPECIES: hypothetical protein [unclassified Psychrobacter]|uniref:hypothetical protein n=1 Tax=unclassified Psychrobacter TaxID=196806 RepID=UPI0018F61DE4|nr:MULTISPECIES: hypothetical protein [unclassified Psychrobacter]